MSTSTPLEAAVPRVREVLVVADDVRKVYEPSGFVAVAGIDFDLTAGECFGFLGPNGAGKSSTMRMIACVSPLTSGTLRVLGMDATTHGSQIRARIGVVPSFLVVITVFGLVTSPWIVLVFQAAALIGFAFASAGLVVVTYLRNWADMAVHPAGHAAHVLVRDDVLSAGIYPRWLQLVIECLPLFQSIQLVREPALGHVGPSLLVPAGYLLVMGTGALAWALRRLTRVLTH